MGATVTAYAISLALAALVLWLVIVAWACIVTGGNRQPETPIGTGEDRQP